jgi:outer membrane protein OmpA-like peptidoglycan-associated protein
MTIRKLIYSTIIAVGAAIGFSGSAAAKEFSFDKYHDEITELTVDENVMTPKVPQKHLLAVKNAMRDLSKKFQNYGFEVGGVRGGEVVVATIPVEKVFAPNDTVIHSWADVTLGKFLPHLAEPDFYKVLVTVHSDNTGTEEYLNTLTVTRAEAIVDWFEAHSVATDGIVPYGIGMDENIADNNSRASRAANRRIEIYFIPGPVMLEWAKAGKL